MLKPAIVGIAADQNSNLEYNLSSVMTVTVHGTVDLVDLELEIVIAVETVIVTVVAVFVGKSIASMYRSTVKDGSYPPLAKYTVNFLPYRIHRLALFHHISYVYFCKSSILFLLFSSPVVSAFFVSLNASKSC